MSASLHGIVLGGSGALGRAVIHSLQRASIVATCVDFTANPEATSNVMLDPEASWQDQFSQMSREVSRNATKPNGIIVVAGGFLLDDDTTQAAELNWKMNVQPAYAGSVLARSSLSTGGLLLLTGAYGAYKQGISFAPSYGMAKAATHSLAESIQASDAPWDTLCILPRIIDTEANRAAMPDENHAIWTPPETIAARITEWLSKPEERPRDDIFVQV